MQTDYTAPPRGVLSPEAARPYLIAEFGHLCFRCGLAVNDERPNMDIDHIIPVARGGGNYYGNYQFLCGPCNSWKGTQIIDFRPGDPRKIDAGLQIIPNEERVRKLPQKPVPIVIVPRVPDPERVRFLAELTGPVEQVLSAALRTGDDAAIDAAKAMALAAITEDVNIAIARGPEHISSRVLPTLLSYATHSIDLAYELRRAGDVREELISLVNRTLTTAERGNNTSREALDQRDRRERLIALLFLYVAIVTVALTWSLF